MANALVTRSIAALIVACLVGLTNVAYGSAPALPRPNVILIVADDLGYQDLGCFGAQDAITPNIDRLAKEGIRLTSFYVAWPACTPSRAALLTGRYPQRNGTYDMIRNDMVNYGHRYTPEEYAVSPERLLGTDVREVFISDVLKEAGYKNGCFGKWDGGQLRRYLPLQRGFHDFYGFTNTGIDYFTHERYGVPSMRRGNELTEVDRGTYATYLFQREAVRFVKEHRSEPFFVYLPFNAPHGASNLDPEVKGSAQAPDEYLAMFPESTAKNAKRRRIHLAATTCMDAAIGELLKLLDDFNIADNTMVIFLSDNGGAGGGSNGPLRGAKSQMFEGGLRVPCVIRWPKQISAGKTSDAFLTSLELFPMIVDAVGAQRPQVVLDGFNMLPVLRGEVPSQRKEMFWQRRGDRAARVDNWKWVESARGGGLFDLAHDLSEKKDLSSQHPDVLKMVRSRWDAWRKAMDESEPRGPFRDY